MSNSTHFGYTTVAEEEKVHKVAEVFHSVAAKYDIMNDVMSGGLHRLWKIFTIAQAGVRPGFKVLDIAGGTGDLPKYGHIYKEQQAAGLLWKNPLMDDDFRHGLKVIPEMNLQPGEGVLTNWLLGAFTMSGLDIWLKMRDVKTIVFGGFAGHSAVFNSTIQAADYWYNVVIPRDASCVLLPRITMPGVADVKPYDKKVEEVIFDIMAPIYSLVTTTKDVIAHL